MFNESSNVNSDYKIANNNDFMNNTNNNENQNINNMPNNNMFEQPLFADNNKKNKKKYGIFILIGIIIIVVILVVVLSKNDKPERAKILMTLEKTDYLKIKLGDDEFYLGDEVANYKGKNYVYDITDDNYKVSSDALILKSFTKEDKSQFLGALYCPTNSDCDYDDTLLLKINFYKDSNVIVNDYITYDLTYDDIVKKYGKEDGTFYQDSNLLVWTFGEKGKIGEPYYILEFDEGSWFPTHKIIDIRVGVWWYEGEYEHTVVKGKSEK